ncbi:MAG: PadR family transcriptional regulator [Thaumarchaeota archaeon]|nr:PadR family transcriptional regulator [Nitrososphaerota archaeon]
MNILREFFLGFVKIHILYHAGKEGFCGADMMTELDRHGYTIGPGTLYPLLHTMMKGGYLRSEKKVERGRARIYYSATPKARIALREIRPKINELVSEVLE